MSTKRLKSIWDGWKKQCYYRFKDGDAFCAMGYIGLGTDTDWDGVLKTHESTLMRVAAKIVEDHPETASGFYGNDDVCWAWDVIASANNDLKLTPADFRRIDRETQREKGEPVETPVR